MIVPKFYGTIKQGKIEMNAGETDLINSYLLQFKEGQEIETTIKKKYKKRSSGQQGEEANFNGYLFGVVYKIIGDEMGEIDTDYIHHWAQIKTGNIKIMKDGTSVPAGTSHMSGGEFSEYCSKVRIWASKELNCYVPDPNEAEWQR
jgi:hypothetical protein